MAREKRKVKRIWKIMLWIAACVFLFGGAAYLNHRLALERETELRKPLGQMVAVGGHDMSVYVEGAGSPTLVYMSGAGTASPILDFRSLYSLLSERYKIAAVEKFGYGFSEVTDRSRDIDTILSDTRAALKAAGVEGPYVLCPHSISGIEALYWAQRYADEVVAIVGLDMAGSEFYEEFKVNLPVYRLLQGAAAIGLPRLLPDLIEGDAIKYGTLTELEKEIYRAVVYDRTLTANMIEEAAAVKENAAQVAEEALPDAPMLLFVSDASGTGFEPERWQKMQTALAANSKFSEIILLNSPH